MKRFWLAIVLVVVFVEAKTQIIKGAKGETFSVRVVKDELSDPWEVTYGPDNYLWITEAKGYKVSRINPATGEQKVLIDLSSKRNFPRYDKIKDEEDGGKPWPQGGLMGLALHPQFQQGKPYVYLSYIYHFAGANQQGNGSAPNLGGNFFTARIVRYEYDSTHQSLVHEAVICDTIPASNDHNAGRLIIAPEGDTNYLFYSVGEMGAGQFANAGRTNYAQQVNKYEGKILRFNLEPLNEGPDWIPNDNPFNTNVKNAVWTLGHRNPQGLTYAVVAGKGRIYTSEHGPYGDDEVNIIEKGKNYGHPLVIGYNDNNYNGFAASVSDRQELPGIWHTTYPLIVSEDDNVKKIGKETYRNPIKSFYPIKNKDLSTIFSATINNNPNKPDWKAEAPSSIDVYTSSKIPGWKNSLLIPTLKGGRLVRLQLNSDGNGITGDTIGYFQEKMRYRDIAISPDGSKIYLSVDSSIVTSGPSEQKTKGTNYNGCIIEYTYIDGGTALNTSRPRYNKVKHKASPARLAGK